MTADFLTLYNLMFTNLGKAVQCVFITVIMTLVL